MATHVVSGSYMTSREGHIQIINAKLLKKRMKRSNKIGGKVQRNRGTTWGALVEGLFTSWEQERTRGG